MIVNLEEHEWSQIISIIANSHPLIYKISSQLVSQREMLRERNAGIETHQEGKHPEEIPAVGAHSGERGTSRILDGTGNSDGKRRSQERG